MGLGGFARFWALEFRFRVGKGPNHTPGIEPATLSRVPDETAARPMSYPGHGSVGRRLSHKPFWGGSRAQFLRVSFGPFAHPESRFWGDQGLWGHRALVGYPALGGLWGDIGSEGGERLETP